MRILQARTALRLRARLQPRRVVLTDAKGELTARDLDGITALMHRGRTATSARSVPRCPPQVAELPPDAPLRQVLATALTAGDELEMRSSGSTGPPHLQRRGPLSAAQLRTLRDLARRIGLRGGASIASAAPGVHGHGLLVGLGALVLGSPLVDLSHLRPAQRVQLLHRERPQLLTGVPVHLADVLAADREHARGRPLQIPRVISGSDVLPAALRADLARHFRARVHDVYGTTETGPIAVDGRPLAGVRIRAQDGLLIVRTPFTRGKELVTDRGHLDEQGRVRVTGRADGTVSSGGMLHDPRAVARLLVSHPGVAAVRLRVVEDERFGARTVAEVTPSPGEAAVPTGQELRSLVRDRLGAAAVPREVVLLSSPGD